jgi:hypothetical protein
MTLKDHLLNNNFVLSCPHCKLPVYEYVGKMPILGQQIIRAADFRPLGKAPKPEPMEKMICPFCGDSLSHQI